MDWIDKTVDWWEAWMDTAEKCTWDEYVGTLKDKLRAAHKDGCEHKAEVERLKDLCLRAAFYIGVRQGPEVDEEADELLRKLKGET